MKHGNGNETFLPIIKYTEDLLPGFTLVFTVLYDHDYDCKVSSQKYITRNRLKNKGV